MPFKSDFFWIFMDFWKENEGKLAPKSIKIDVNCEKWFFEKSCSRCSGSTIFMVLRVEVGIQNRSKINLKIYSKIKCVLASIFLDFGRQVGVEMAPKIDAKTHRKNDANSDAFWMRLGWVFRCSVGRAMATQPRPPLLHYQKKQQTKHTNAQDQ